MIRAQLRGNRDSKRWEHGVYSANTNAHAHTSTNTNANAHTNANTNATQYLIQGNAIQCNATQYNTTHTTLNTMFNNTQ